jgi:alkylation response protein AidB-like acyl-CoA dehydrogenase
LIGLPRLHLNATSDMSNSSVLYANFNSQNGDLERAEVFRIADRLAEQFRLTAPERDLRGGSPQHERKLIRDSGLLRYWIPKGLGGLGGNWPDLYQIIRTFARVDSSIAQVFAFQFLMLASIRLYGNQFQSETLLRETAERNWWWGNALNPLDKRTVATRHGNHYLFHGQKSFCSGALHSDRLIVSGLDSQTGKLLIAAVDTARDGIHLFDDWDNFGQRQSDSGSADFNNVRVENCELLMDPGPLSSPFSALRSLVAQLIFTNIYLGLAEGAVAEAVNYTRESGRVWSGSLASNVEDDPYVLLHYGQLHAGLQATRVLTDNAALMLDAAWAKGLALTEEERGEVALAVFTAKVNATQSGLDATSKIFELTGPRATTARLRLDRYWRNLRVYSLHDPVDYKYQELGNWVLNKRYPKPGFYS